MKSVVQALCVVLCLGSGAYAEDDGGDNDASPTVTEKAPQAEEACEAGNPCKKKPVNVIKDFGSMNSKSEVVARTVNSLF